ncbi:24034_t:CDS:2 [Gigaspora margarita]|uniref:24034_t:CDS:1 n=1 Tax=Gigaspora margarita TaxID=4874 RepID=A0ABN7UXN8_GIGMA|nr:24034_t:CDS:2 [Gigaspora margarita]
MASIETKEKHIIVNTNIKKQNWDEIMEEETRNFKDIMNTVNPWVDANSSEPIVEKHDMVEETKSDNLHDKKPEGLEGLPEDCFFENIDDMLGLSNHKMYEQPTSCWDKMALRREFYRRRNSTTTNKETEDTPELGRGTTHKQTDTQMDVAPQEVQRKPEEMVEEKETSPEEEAATTPTAVGSPTGEENLPTIKSAAPPVPMALPKEELIPIVAEPIKDKLATAYGESREQKIPQPMPVERDTRIEKIQTNMFTQ